MDSDTKFEERASRFLKRTQSSRQNNEQVIKFISEIYKVKNDMISTEKKLDTIDARLWSDTLRSQSENLADQSEKIYNIQQIIVSPSDSLHEVQDIKKEDIDEEAVDEILTQLEWDALPQELNRLHETQNRVYSKFNTNRQIILTNRVLLLSLIAISISVIGLFI